MRKTAMNVKPEISNELSTMSLRQSAEDSRASHSDTEILSTCGGRKTVVRTTVESIVLIAAGILLLISATGCSGLKDARDIKQGPMPKKYYATRDPEPVTPDGSLWQDRASLYEDRKARRVNDLLTIIISETTNATKKAGTNASRTSSADYSITNAFNANLSQSVPSLPLLKDFYSGRNFIPSVQGDVSSTFAGKGDTSRAGTLTATITAKVIEVLPNSSMVVESRKEVVVNNEKEIVVLRGIVRPEDISTNNTISSAYVADAQIYLVGDGVLDDKQSQGWLVRVLDKVWPF
jgi:flagellar L-ring protein FlgH